MNPLPSGPGMYSIPPDCYGYPPPTLPETPSKTSRTPRKKTTPPKESALNRLLSTPAPMHIMQQQVPSMRPQVMQQQPPHSLSQPIYSHEEMVIQICKNVTNQQQMLGPHQSLQQAIQPQHQQYPHQASLPQQVQFQQLSLSSPQQLQHHTPQSEQLETYIPPQHQQQQPMNIMPQQNKQRASSLSHIHQQRYSNSGRDSLSNNPIMPQINSPYSNGPMPHPSTPILSNPLPANFYSSPEVPLNESPEMFQFSPNNPQLPNRLSNFNSTLIYNPNINTTATASPPKTQQGKRSYSRTNNDEIGETSKRMKENFSTQSHAVRASAISTVEQSLPPNNCIIDNPIIQPSTSSIQGYPQASGTYVSSSMNQRTPNISYASAFTQQVNPQLKVAYGLQEHNSPFAEANNFYNCTAFDSTRIKEPLVEVAPKNQASVSVSSRNLSHPSSDLMDQSNPTSSTNSSIPVSTEQIVYNLQTDESNDIDPCEEFMDPEVIHRVSQEYSMRDTIQGSKEPESKRNVEDVVLADVNERDNSQMTEIFGEPIVSNDKQIVPSQIEEPEHAVEAEKDFESSSYLSLTKETEECGFNGNHKSMSEPVTNFVETAQMTNVSEENVVQNNDQNDTIEELEVEKEVVSVPLLNETSEAKEDESDAHAEAPVEKYFADVSVEENNSLMTEVFDETKVPTVQHKNITQMEEAEVEKETELFSPLNITTEGEGKEAEQNITDFVEIENSQMTEIIEEITVPNDEHTDALESEKQQSEEKTESSPIISVMKEIEEIEEGEIVDSEEESTKSNDEILDSEFDKRKYRKRSRSVESDEPPVVEEKRHKSSTEPSIVSPKSVEDNALQQEFEKIDIIELNEAEFCVKNDEENTDNLPNEAAILLLADSPVVNPPTPTVIQNTNESDDVVQSSIHIPENEVNSKDSENKIDEASLLSEIPAIEEPMDLSENPVEEIFIANTSENHDDEIMNEVVRDVQMMDIVDDNNEDTPPSYEELLQNCEEDLSIGNDENLSRFGANAAMDAATTIVTLNVMRNEVYQLISDLSSTTSVEQSIMINIVSETVDSELAEIKNKYLNVIKVIDKSLETSTMKCGMHHGTTYEGAMYEVLIPLYTAAVKWEKQSNKKPEFYLNIGYVKKLLLSIIANFGSNDSSNIYHELFALQMFTVSKRLDIFYQLLTKSINICPFMDEYFSLTNNLFNVTQLAPVLFINDYEEFKTRDPRLANVIIAAVQQVRELSPELRSRIIFQFQLHLNNFLHKFEKSNILPEAYSFVSTLSWDAKTFGNSWDLPQGYLPIIQTINPTVEKIFKETLQKLHKSGTLEIKGWTYNLSKSIMQSNFMTKIIRNTNNLQKEVQEALFAEIIPSLLKLVLSVPHLFVAADPYHSLELIPSVFEDALPILNKAAEDIHEQMSVPFMPFATIIGALKSHQSQSTTSLLKICHNLYLTLKNAATNIPEAIQAERRRCSNKTLYEKIHREYVRRQMANYDFEKYENDANKLDLKHLHLLISKLFTTKTLETPPRIIAGIKEGVKEPVSTEKVFRARIISKCCRILKEALDSVTVEQKLKFMIDHPLLNENLKIDDILNVHQFGEDMLGCFTAFIGLLSLPDNKVLGDPKSSTFFNSIKERRNAIYYYAIKNSALIKNHKPPIPIQILNKDVPIYEILVQIFVTAEMKRILCCPDNVTSYLYLALIINDIPGISIGDASQQLFDVCGITENKVEFFATANFSKDLEAKIETMMNKELEELVKNVSSHVASPGIPRITHHQLSSCQTRINQLKCLIIEITATFWNPHKLLLGVGLTLECRKKIEDGIKELGKQLLTGFYHMGKTTVTVADLKDMIFEEMQHIQGESFMNYENSSLYGFVIYIQKIFNVESTVSSILIILYMLTITHEKQVYAQRLTLSQRIAIEPTLLKIFGLKNSELIPLGIINDMNQLMKVEELFEADYIFHASETDPHIFHMFLDRSFKKQYKELIFALESDCIEIKRRFRFHVNNQRNLYHPNVIPLKYSVDIPLINPLPKNIEKLGAKEVPEDFYYFTRS
uniref:Uncharacterized protein n=1 Tax=Panagrolaimus superbus TaxID=310955 RepID=A0A914YLY2_9BILA